MRDLKGHGDFQSLSGYGPGHAGLSFLRRILRRFTSSCSDGLPLPRWAEYLLYALAGIGTGWFIANLFSAGRWGR